MEDILVDQSILFMDNDLQEKIVSDESNPSIGELITNQNAFINATNKKDNIKKYMTSFNVKYTDDISNISGLIIKDFNNVGII